jgi:hypothetical protein
MSAQPTKPIRSTARKVDAAPAKAAPQAPVRKKAVGPSTKPAMRPVASAPAPASAPAAAARVGAALAKAAKSAKVSKAGKPEKQRVKLVRDSFAMPVADFVLIDALKVRAIAAKRPAKKSELLRAGLKALAALTPLQLAASLDALTPIKTGRPKKGH